MTFSRQAPVLVRLGAAALAAALFVSCVTNPVTGKSQFSLVGEEEEKALGAQAYGPMVQESYGAANDAELQAFVQRVGRGLADVSHRPALDYEFKVVNANYDNAFALPGGKICITRGLLSRMTSEDQLAGVLGHEAGHVTARHGAVGMTRALLVQGVLGLGAAVLEAEGVKGRELYLGAAGIGAQLVLSRYTRDQERQSDDLGMQYMTKAGYNPKGFVESMEILKAAHEREPSKLEALFQSHPVTSERIETGNQRVATTYAAEAARPTKKTEFAAKTRALKAEAPAFKLADEGEKAMAKKEYRAAAAKFDEAARLAPKQAILPALKAVALLQAGEHRDAREAAEKAKRIDPGLYFAYLAGGFADYKLSDYRGAIADLDAAEKAASPTLATVYTIGRSHEALGEKEKAAERYKQIVQSTQEGEEYQHSRKRLLEWGYLAQPTPAPGG